MSRPVSLILTLAVVIGVFSGASIEAATTSFFNSSQVAINVASGVTSDTISSEGYLFTYTRDKLFTGGYGMTEPIGRTVRVPWPQGVEAQAVTAGPSPSGARMTIQRADGAVFDLPAFTAKLLANTGGAGGSIEIMPKLNGEDAFNDPVYFNATGYYGQSLSYDASTPSYLGNTTALKGFESYTIGLYVDFALTALTLHAADPVPANLTWSGAANGSWDINSTANFSGSATGKYHDGDYVTFDDTGNHPAITIGPGGVAPGSMDFWNTPAVDYLLSGGPITGTTGLTVNGGGRVTLSGANAYAGDTWVGNGTLVLASPDALPPGGNVIVDNGGVLVLPSGLGPAAASAASPGLPIATAAVPEPGSLALVIVAALFGWAMRASTNAKRRVASPN